MDKDNTNSSSAQIKVNANSVVGSTYAQIVSFSVTDVDTTLEFVYINPQIKTEGQTVARVTVPLATATELAKIITDTIRRHEENKKRA